ANGIRIHYWRTGGDKPVLIMAHGSSDDGLCWTNLAAEFTANYDIIMYDARGHGLSDPPKAGDPADAQAEDLAALIKALNITKPIVMGHSMGSSAAAWFAAKYPDVPRAVILEDPNLATRRPASVVTDPEARRNSILAGNNRTWDEIYAGCLKNQAKWGVSECAYWTESKRRHHPLTASGTAAMRPAMQELLPKITAPTLILKADAQGELRQQNDATAKLLPKGTLVHITGAGHNVRRENKAMTIAEMKKFLAGL
ncbi:MAG: alpha/beta hydrolase, partial [Bryobacteraceae bacterium]|nr:alpha/beta hydrolase [Bryobacteraceae bacterium]